MRLPNQFRASIIALLAPGQGSHPPRQQVPQRTRQQLNPAHGRQQVVAAMRIGLPGRRDSRTTGSGRPSDDYPVDTSTRRHVLYTWEGKE